MYYLYATIIIIFIAAQHTRTIKRPRFIDQEASIYWPRLRIATFLVAITIYSSYTAFYKNKYFELLPQLELLAVFSRNSGYDNMSEQCNHICPCRKYDNTQFHSGMGTQTQTDCTYINEFPFFESLPHLELYQRIWLVMHMLAILQWVHIRECQGAPNSAT